MTRQLNTSAALSQPLGQGVTTGSGAAHSLPGDACEDYGGGTAGEIFGSWLVAKGFVAEAGLVAGA